jgi:hypothetical protein
MWVTQVKISKKGLKNIYTITKGLLRKQKIGPSCINYEINSKSEALILERKIKKRGAKRYLNEIASR